MERFEKLGEILIANKDKFIKRKDLLEIPDIALLYATSKDYTRDIYFKNSARELTRDIQKLNDYDKFPYIVISNSYLGIKIATEKEDFEYLNKEKINTLKVLKRYYNKINKLSLLQQQQFDLGI